MNSAGSASKRRIVPAAIISTLIAATIAACGTSTLPAEPTPPDVPSPSASVSPSSAPGEPSPPVSPPGTPSFEGHAAAGLALVRFPEPGSSVSHVFVVEADGSFRQVSGVSRADSPGAAFPVWSPDGSQIVFAPPKITGGEESLSVVNADGSGERQFAELQDEYDGLHLQWSADGSSVLYFDLDPAEGSMVWLADLESGEVRYLAAGSSPRWMPDGRISFGASVEGEGDPAPLEPAIFIMDPNGGEPIEFARASDAIWSPDGSSVLLQAAQDLLVMADADGSNQRDFVQGWAPAWSPDGSTIVFAYDHNDDGLPLLAAVDREGRRLWSGVVGESPAWSSDGTRLAVEIRYPDLMVQVLDATSGAVLWDEAGTQPAWAP